MNQVMGDEVQPVARMQRSGIRGTRLGSLRSRITFHFIRATITEDSRFNRSLPINDLIW